MSMEGSGFPSHLRITLYKVSVISNRRLYGMVRGSLQYSDAIHRLGVEVKALPRVGLRRVFFGIEACILLTDDRHLLWLQHDSPPVPDCGAGTQAIASDFKTSR